MAENWWKKSFYLNSTNLNGNDIFGFPFNNYD